ncbi:hypothetical protein M3Y99_01099500 [Aphelenchoides fujianensis]|nr:hypothetical protein M3Y99_01099500 [Aphelenchoides fujianensis]
MVRSKLSAKAVICGGGLMGLSVAHQLARRGAAVMLFERDCIGAFSETQPANTGLVTAPYFWPDAMAQRMARRSLRIYEELAKNAGFKFTRCGRVYLANSDEAIYHIKRIHSRALVHSEDNELLDCPSEMLARWPLLSTEDVRVSTNSYHFIVDCCLLSSWRCTRWRTSPWTRSPSAPPLADSARENGAQIFENCEVRKVMVGENHTVFAVDTEEGLVDTRIFINCAGALSNMIPISPVADRYVIPAYPCSYSILMTEALQHSGLSDSTPAFVDVDHGVFVYPNNERTIAGGFAESAVTALRLPSGAQMNWTVPQPDWDKFYPILKHLIERIPSMGQLATGDLVSEVEMYTPDMYPVIGESDRIHGYFVANGLNGQGLAMAGGLGEVLAQWVLEGASSLKPDISKFDLQRYSRQHTNPQYLYERAPEIASYTFKPLHYSHQCHTARNLRMSPVFHQLRNAGAMFGEIMGYERPLYFEPEKANEPGRNAIYSGQCSAFGPPEWHKFVAKEYEACRERVGLIDMTSFSKFEVTGKAPDSVDFLSRLCSGQVDRPIGSTVYTGMQNEAGGYVTDCTLSRLGEKHFFIVAPSVQQVRAYLWMQQWIRQWAMNVHVQDVTAAFTALDLVGPASRYLMQDITGQTINSTTFPSFSFREIHVGMAAGVRAVSVSHCGELGWMLYVPNEIAHYVYEKIVEAGQEYSLQHAGYYALRHLRIEKFFVFWGTYNATVTPLEAGRMFRVDLSKDFIGKQALLEQADQPPRKRYVQLLVDNFNFEDDPWPTGDEPIYRDSKVVGWTTSAAYGFTLGSQVCIGYLRNDEGDGVNQDFLNTGIFQVDIAGKRFPVRVNLHSPTLPMVSSEAPHHFRPTQ